jgi:hypothetical protein
MSNVTPFARTELLKLIAVTTLTQVSKLAFKAGNTADDIVGAALEADYTRQGAYNAIRSAGHRTRKERSDKGQTLRLKINKLVEEANALQAKVKEEVGVK